MYRVAVEGLDRSGKTYLIRRLQDALKAQGRKVEVLRDATPYPTHLTKWVDTAHGTTADLVYTASLLAMLRYEDTLSPEVDVVIYDRYLPTYVAYSTIGDGPKWMEPVHDRISTLVQYIAAVAPAPDILVFLDTSLTSIEYRCGATGEPFDYERESRIRARMLTAIDALGAPVLCVDETVRVQDTVRDVVRALYPEEEPWSS